MKRRIRAVAQLSLAVLVGASCFGDRSLPAVALTDAATRILVVAVNADEFVNFVDGIRVVSRSRRFVAAQMSTGMPLEDLSFTVAATNSMTWCDMSHDRLVICNEIHHNG